MKKIIVILGPTAIGKTSFAIKKAKEYNTEIISFDSRQFYKEMTIGTAVPSSQELKEVKHHFIQNISINQKYTIGDYQIDATNLINKLLNKKEIVIMVGGSGMYLDSVLYGLDIFPKIPKKIRDEIIDKYNEKGIHYLQELLKKNDEKYYNIVDKNNPHRLIRALEVCLYTNKTFSSFLSNDKKLKIDCEIKKICLIAPREIVYNRINERVDLMIKEGLLEEAKGLYEFRHLNALQTVGYKELFDFLENKVSLEQSIEMIKINTRRFAKRQLTWINNRYDDVLYEDTTY